jgi:DNA-binding CsgD family transcriptional regulator
LPETLNWDHDWHQIRRTRSGLREARPRTAEEAQQVLEYVISGMKASEIAATMLLNARTVEDYFEDIARVYDTNRISSAATLELLDTLTEAAAALKRTERWQMAECILELNLARLQSQKSQTAHRLRADCMRNLADLKRAKGDHLGPAGAISLYDQATQVYAELSAEWSRLERKTLLAQGFRRDLADAAWMRGLCVEETAGPLQGLECYEAAEHIFRNSGTLTNYILGNIRRDQAHAFEMVGALREANRAYHDSATRLGDTDDMVGLGITFVSMGSFLRAKRDLDGALELIDKGLSLIPPNATYHLVKAKKARAELMEDLQNLDEAFRDLYSALEIARASKLVRQEAEVGTAIRRLDARHLRRQ